MAKKVLINVEERELRIAILEEGQLVELYIESLDNKTILNNIYRGKVENILSGLNAVFVNIGFEKNAFLHFHDIRPELLLTPESKADLAAYGAKCAEVEAQLELLEEAEAGIEPAEGATSDAPAAEREFDRPRRERNDRKRGDRRDRNRDRRDRDRNRPRDGENVEATAEAPAAATPAVEATETATPERATDGGTERSDRERDRKRKRRDRDRDRDRDRRDRKRNDRRDNRERSSDDSVANSANRIEEGFAPIDPSLEGTRAAVNPFDAYVPFGQQDGGFKNNRRGGGGRGRRNDKPQQSLAPIVEGRDSQADILGAVRDNDDMHNSFEKFEENGPMPGNEIDGGEGHKRRSNRGPRKTFRRRGPSGYAARKKAEDIAPVAPVVKAKKAPAKKAVAVAVEAPVVKAKKVAAKKAVVAVAVEPVKPAKKTTVKKAAVVEVAAEKPAKKTAVAKKTKSAVAVEVVEAKPAKKTAIAKTTKTKAKAEVAVELPGLVVEAPAKKAPAKKKAQVAEVVAAPAPKTKKAVATKTKKAAKAEVAEVVKTQDVATPATPVRKRTTKTAKIELHDVVEPQAVVVEEPQETPAPKRGRGGRPVKEKEFGRRGNSKSDLPAAISLDDVVPHGDDVQPAFNTPAASPEPYPSKSHRTAEVASISLTDIIGKPVFPKRPYLRSLPVMEGLKRGDEILVQVIKEEIGVKGARITSFVSLPGRYLVLMPNADEEGAGGVSRKVSDFGERKRLKKVLQGIRREINDRSVGVIVRTAGMDRDESEIRADAGFLGGQWKRIRASYEKTQAPAMVYDDSDILHRLARDVFDDNITEIEIDSAVEADKLKDMLGRLIPSLVDKVKVYDRPVNIFEHYDVERQIVKAGRRKVWLKSGGYLIIDEAEALTAIDVNSGKFVGKDDQEKMILKTNQEAARAIARELRLRDIGGIIVIDFIDMRDGRNKDALLSEFRGLMRKDRARTNVSGISEFGLVEMTRKRVRRSLRRTIFTDCPYCQGAGVILNDGQVWLHIKHEIVGILNGPNCPAQLCVQVNPKMQTYIETNYKDTIAKWLEDFGTKVEFESNPALHSEQYGIESFGEGLSIDEVKEFAESQDKK